MRLRKRARRPDRPLLRQVQGRHPPLSAAVLADARIASRQRGDAWPRGRIAITWQVLRLVTQTDAFGALFLYRVRTSLQRRGIHLVPGIAHRLAVTWAQVSIGDPVLIQPGVLLPHGQVVIDGFCEIGSGARIRPFVTIGLVDGVMKGPTIGRDVKIGTGAKILGPVKIGDRATVGANAVVIRDVMADAVVAGVPAAPVG